MKKMFTRWVALATLLVATCSLSAQNLLREDFDYLRFDSLPHKSLPWDSVDGNKTQYLLSGLSLKGHPGSGVGKAVFMPNTSIDIARPFAPVTSGVLYGSAIVKVDSLHNPSGPVYFLHFTEPNSKTSYPCRIWISSKGDSIAVRPTSGNFTTNDSLRKEGVKIPVAKGKPFFVAFKYSFSDSLSYMFVCDTVPPTEPAASEWIQGVGKGNVNITLGISRISLRQGIAQQYLWVDALRVAKTWDDMFTPKPKPNLLITKLYLHHNTTTNAPYQHSFVEIYNAGTESVDLSEYTLMYVNNSNLGAAVTTERAFGKTYNTQKNQALPGAIVAPGAHYLLAGNLNAGLDSRSMPLVPDQLLPGFSGQAIAGAVVISQNSNMIYVDSVFFNRAGQKDIVNMMVFGKLRRFGASDIGTGPVFPNVAPQLSPTTVAGTGDFSNILVRRKEGDNYVNTGNDSLDWEKKKAVEVTLFSTSNIPYSLYSENFQRCIDSNLINKFRFRNNDTIGKYVTGWTSNDRVYWEYDESAAGGTAPDTNDNVNIVKKGIKVGTGANSGWFQTKNVTMDAQSRLLRFQIMPFVADDKDEYTVDMELFVNGTKKSVHRFETFDAEGGKWYHHFFPIPSGLKDSLISFRFSTRMSDAVVTNRFGFKDLSMPIMAMPALVESFTLAQANAVNSSNELINNNKLVRVEGVVQSSNWAWVNSTSATGSLQNVIYHNGDYLQIQSSGFTVSKMPKAGDKVGITGTLEQSAGAIRVAKLENFRIYSSDNALQAYVAVDSVTFDTVSHRVKYENVICMDTATTGGTSNKVIRFLKGSDTVRVTFTRNYLEKHTTPALNSLWDAVGGYGYIDKSTGPFNSGFSILVNDSLSLIKNDPTSLRSEQAPLQVRLYPNPSSDGKISLRLDGEKARTIRVYNLAGVEVLRKTTSDSQVEIDLGKKPGLYFVCIGTPDGNIDKTVKVVVR